LKEQELYEVQHRDGKCVPHYTFPFLRKVFRRFDSHREDLVLSLVDGGERLLDIGCGSGSLVFRAKPRFQEAYGVDISSFCIGEAEERKVERFGNTPHIRFFHQNVGDGLEFPDGYFDTVTAVAVMEHVFDLYFAIGEFPKDHSLCIVTPQRISSPYSFSFWNIPADDIWMLANK